MAVEVTRENNFDIPYFTRFSIKPFLLQQSSFFTIKLVHVSLLGLDDGNTL